MTRLYANMSKFARSIHDDHVDMADRDMDCEHMELVAPWLVLSIFCDLLNARVQEKV